MVIFAYNAVEHNPRFADGLNIPAISRPAAVSAAPLVFSRSRDDEPTDADRIAWYFAAEIAAVNAELDRMAEESEWADRLADGYVGF